MTEYQNCGRCRQDRPLEAFSPSYRGKKGTWCKPCFAAYARGEKVPQPALPTRICLWCGSTYSPRQERPSQYCSRDCKAKAYRATVASELAASKPRRQCLWCGEEMPNTMRADAKYCCRECNGLAHRQTNKIRRRTGQRSRAVSLAAIAKRDNYRCRICGGKVDMSLKHPDPLFGSLDHIVPLADGGTHEAANLQLAHLRCNLAKGTRAMNDQLRLV